MRKLSIALALIAMNYHIASSPSTNLVTRRQQVPDPVRGMIPKQKAQFGKPPKKLHNRGIGMGSGRKNR